MRSTKSDRTVGGDSTRNHDPKRALPVSVGTTHDTFNAHHHSSIDGCALRSVDPRRPPLLPLLLLLLDAGRPRRTAKKSNMATVVRRMAPSDGVATARYVHTVAVVERCVCLREIANDHHPQHLSRSRSTRCEMRLIAPSTRAP